MANVPIQVGQPNYVLEDASNPHVTPHVGGIGGFSRVRISVTLATGANQNNQQTGGIGGTNLVLQMSLWEADRLRDELSKALGELGG